MPNDKPRLYPNDEHWSCKNTEAYEASLIFDLEEQTRTIMKATPNLTLQQAIQICANANKKLILVALDNENKGQPLPDILIQCWKKCSSPYTMDDIK